MKKELDDNLCSNFPLLYADRNAPMSETSMCWGFTVGDGWYNLIWDLSLKLETIIKELKEKHPDLTYHPRATQVKEKYGTLRFYLSSGNDEMYKLIDEATNKSAKTCELCGAKGKLRDDGGWYRTLCNKCVKKT